MLINREITYKPGAILYNTGKLFISKKKFNSTRETLFIHKEITPYKGKITIKLPETQGITSKITLFNRKLPNIIGKFTC